MPLIAILFGALLTALGLTAYFSPDLIAGGKANERTALSPAGVGGVLILAGLISLAAPHLRKHAMHFAAVAGVIGVIGGCFPIAIRSFRYETAVLVGAGMTGLSAVFLFLCVRSFIAARKAREAAAVNGGA